ncbi:uncharacterized protein LOC118242987 [Electrophorus electricus]|uniref:uncharacterized protein LOC118242987 n=1 Tax=Electrophorus electricus TaxID=8005 RepID=UPI0015D0AEAD|nr:uncharacterized protein LOC118242987 [Electrophorus electricus]
MLLFAISLLLTLFWEISTQKIDALETVKRVSEGDPVTLSCKYSVSGNNYALQWYLQYSRSRPAFIDYILPSQTDRDSVLPGMSVNLDKNQSRVDLLISFATISNSALYYCALAPTVTGNPAMLYKKTSHREGVFCADQIGPNQDQDTEVFHEEGQSVTLECSYDSTNQYIDLYWYRQHPNKAPQYLLYKPARSSLSTGHISDRQSHCDEQYEVL